MSVYVSAEAITVRTADRALLDSVSLGVQDTDRIGVLGLNGAGKSALLQVLAGEREPDSGRVAIAGGVRIAMVGQATTFAPDATVRGVILGDAQAADHVWASDAEVRAVLAGLGMTAIGLDSRLDELSGGQQRRVLLAAALVTDAELLILDEPTNHLDLEGIAYLAGHVQQRRGAVIAVTHDRWFLDAVAQSTWEVVDGRVEIRDGGYSDWIFARVERERMAQAAEDRRRNLARKELAWLRRGAPARSSKPRYRVEAAESLIADVPPPRNTTELVALAKHRLGKDVLELINVTVELPDGRVLLDHVDRIIGPGDRIALLGPNGAGKSTLLKLLAGDLSPSAGRVKTGQTVRLGFVRQQPEPVDPDLRVLAALEEVAGTVTIDGKQLSVSALAERFGFSPAQQRQQVARLSGGERRRLDLLRVLATEPNVLLLDEPTNDLDTDTLAALEDLLDTWPGTLIVASHDRYLVERITDIVLSMPGDGTLTHRPGGVDQYVADRQAASAAAVDEATEQKASSPHAEEELSSGEARQLRKSLQRWEKQMESLRRKEQRLHTQLADTGADFERAASLGADLKAVREELADVETQWLQAAEALEG